MLRGRKGRGVGSWVGKEDDRETGYLKRDDLERRI